MNTEVVDNIVKIILALSLAFSLVGISIQIIRILGTTNILMKDLHYVVLQFMEIIETIKNDYEGLKAKLDGVLEPIMRIKDNFLNPLAKITGTVGAYADTLRERMERA
jgi:hypothetical protein